MWRRYATMSQGILQMLEVSTRYYTQSLFPTSMTLPEPPNLVVVKNPRKVHELIVKRNSKEIKECLPDHLVSRIERLSSSIPRDVKSLLLLEETSYDQSVWCDESAQERQLLTDSFTKRATHICQDLESLGYWSDFIDPASGLLYKDTSYSESPVCDTDEDFPMFSDVLDLTDIGCCRALYHSHWGFFVFAGVILSNAPSDILKKYQYDIST